MREEGGKMGRRKVGRREDGDGEEKRRIVQEVTNKAHGLTSSTYRLLETLRWTRR